MLHEHKVQAVVAQVRAQATHGVPVAFQKASVSHFVPNPHAADSAPRIDLKPLNQVLKIDPVARLCVAESGVTFEDLVQATLPHGLIPFTVPELKGITLGGAVSGCSVEAMSYRYGGFHDSCLEYEVITGTGEVLTCSPERDPELFHMLHGSYGTLGILTKLTFKLHPAKPFVRMKYVHFERLDAFWTFLKERCELGDYELVDAIIHGPNHFVVCLGTLVDYAPRVSSYERLNIYYKSTATLRSDTLTTPEYCFRYDAECHWLSRTVPPLENRLVRLLVGKYFLGSTNMITWSKRLRPLLRMQRRPDVVVDVFIPQRNFERFFRWYEQAYDFWPLWIVPYRAPEMYPWLADGFQERMGENLLIDCAIYGKPNSDPQVDHSEVLERKVYELDGIKTLISRNHYDRDTFWSIYSQPRWRGIKERTDPGNLFGELYQRMHPEAS